MGPNKPAWAFRRREGWWASLRIAAWRFSTAFPEFVKRLLDIAVSAGSLALVSPVFAAISVLIKLEDGGPILYWQTRVGKHGKLIAFPKFRSMVLNADAKLAELRGKNQHGNTITFKIKDDPRITRVGRVLRRFSLDEAPQLWRVLTGEMTLVGPRPALPREVARYTVAERRRLDVTPGLTCIWQVSGRSNLAFPIQCRMDIEYIEERSLALDAKLLGATIPAVVSGKGAY